MTLVFSRLKQLARCLSHSQKRRMYISSMCRTWSLQNVGLSIDPASTRENAPLSHFLLFCMYNLCHIIDTSQALNSLEAWWHLCTHIIFALNGQHAGFHLFVFTCLYSYCNTYLRCLSTWMLMFEWIACLWFWISLSRASLLFIYYYFYINLLVTSIWTNKLFVLFFGLLSGDSGLPILCSTCDSSTFAQVMTSTSFFFSKWLPSSVLHHGHILWLIEDSQWSIYHSIALYERTPGERRHLESPSTW